MTYERRTANERKTVALELARRKAEEEPADLEAAGPSDRPTTSEPEISMASDRGQNRYSGNTSSLRKLFFESLSVVFVALVSCLRVVTFLVSSYCFLRGTAGFSSWRGYGLMSSLRHFYVFVSSGMPFVDCATYLGRYLMYGDIHCTDFPCISYTFPFLLDTLLLCYPVTFVTLLPCYLVTLSPYCFVPLSLCPFFTLLPSSLVPLLLCCQVFNFSVFLHHKSQFFFPYRRGLFWD